MSTASPRPVLSPLQLPKHIHDHASDDSDLDDIYRGERPSSPSLSIPSVSSVSSSSSSSSTSSSSFLAGGGLGALATIVEHAISRWARRNRSSSSSTSSSSSSNSSSSSSSRSSITLSRPYLSRRRWNRRNSVTSFQTMNSEKDIAARITRMKALEESRKIPRDFILYLPPSSFQLHTSRRVIREIELDSKAGGVLKTTSLPLIINQLELALKRATKARRRQKYRHHLPGIPEQPTHKSSMHHGASHPDLAGYSSTRDFSRKGRKGKEREQSHERKRHVRFSDGATTSTPSTKAWFLDVASPTWEDLRALGKLLHLHPLTLEDILQQDPREKLDLFPKLGYYFISFRAIETREAREKSRRELQKMNEYMDPLTGHGEGAVGEANVYLVVFNEGICCFHYTDVAEHTERVRNRLSLFEEITTMSSDWIAHGILDSIVDSFFPYLEEIEREVMAIETLVFSPIAEGDSALAVTAPTDISKESSQDTLKGVKLDEGIKLQVKTYSEKSESLDGSIRPRFASPQWTLPLLIRRLRRFFKNRTCIQKSPPMVSMPPSATTLTLRRMARVRRLVTSLGRLLASKSDVITQIRKRLLSGNSSGLGNGSTKGEEVDVAIYMGDVQDHIITLQHSLTHYERMLSQSHPTYLSQLRTTFASTKSGTDKALIYLTTVSISVLSLQTITGSCSMNVNVPSNGPGVYNVFGIVLAIALIVLALYLSLVRYWWKQSKRRRALL